MTKIIKSSPIFKKNRAEIVLFNEYQHVMQIGLTAMPEWVE